MVILSISLTGTLIINAPFLCILQIGELGNGLSEQYRSDTADRIQWRSIRGMRNLVAHSYGSMSKEIIWLTATTDIPSLKRFCEDQLSSET